MKPLDVEPLTDDEREHFRFIVRNTTPAERIEWLEDMRLAFGMEHLRKSLELRFRMQDAENPFTPPPGNDR